MIESSDYRVNPERGKAGRAIHGKAEKFFPLSNSGFCGTCHDVNLVNGFRLEEAFSEFKTSPAAKAGVSCQDCHMGTEPGVPRATREGPAAVVGGKPTRTRKITNHMFIGPDYSVIHPGHLSAQHQGRRARHHPPVADLRPRGRLGHRRVRGRRAGGLRVSRALGSADDRYDARDIMTDNQELLAEAHRQRQTDPARRLPAAATSRCGEPEPKKGLVFQVEVANGTDGHDVPTGFDAERLVFLRVTVTDRRARWSSDPGDLDPNGDVRDLHSLYVHNGELPLDKHLFSLQSRFVTRMVRGGEREQVLAVNYSPDPLPFLRPSTTFDHPDRSAARRAQAQAEHRARRAALPALPGGGVGS